MRNGRTGNGRIPRNFLEENPRIDGAVPKNSQQDFQKIREFCSNPGRLGSIQRGFPGCSPRNSTPGCSIRGFARPCLFPGINPAGMLSFPPFRDFLKQELLPRGFPAAPDSGRAPGIPESEEILRDTRESWELGLISSKKQGWKG